MKKFVFKLDPLLKYREYLERIAQQATARAHMDVQACEAQIRQLELTQRAKEDEMTHHVEKGVPASRFRKFHQYLEALEAIKNEEEENKETLKKILKQKLVELKKKSVDKKAMEVYREKMLTRYQHEANQAEQKELDEVSILKTARQAGNEESL